MTSLVERLSALAETCRLSCSDYSCVRRGACTGDAGHALSYAYRAAESARQRQQQKCACCPVHGVKHNAV